MAYIIIQLWIVVVFNSCLNYQTTMLNATAGKSNSDK